MTEPVDAYDRLPLFQNSRLKRAWTFGMHGGTIPYIMSVACKEQRRECEECSERGKVMNKDCERVCGTFMLCVSNSLYPQRALEINECFKKHGEESALCQSQLQSLAEDTGKEMSKARQQGYSVTNAENLAAEECGPKSPRLSCIVPRVCPGQSSVFSRCVSDLSTNPDETDAEAVERCVLAGEKMMYCYGYFTRRYLYQQTQRQKEADKGF